MNLSTRAKPANATYVAKVVIDPDGNGHITPRANNDSPWAERVEIAWYQDSIKITVPGGTPASITQAYMTGKNQDVIVEVAKMVAPSAVVFEVGEEMISVREPEARILADKLIGFAAGDWEGDVALLEAHGHDRAWLAGALPLAHAIQGVLSGTRETIRLSPNGREADAAFAVYSLPGPSSWDATSGAARLSGAIARHR